MAFSLGPVTAPLAIAVEVEYDRLSNIALNIFIVSRMSREKFKTQIGA